MSDCHNSAPSCHSEPENADGCHSGGCHGQSRIAPPSGAAYYCPMCPGVESAVPSTCPHCGMDLAAALPSADDGLEELAAARRYFIVAAALAVPVLVLAMGPMIAGRPDAIDPGVSGWIQAALTAAAIAVPGRPLLGRAVAAARAGSLNMFSLIAVGVVAAFAFSLAALMGHGAYPNAFGDGAGRPALYFESAAVIVALVWLGQVLELRARRATGDALRSLLALNPDTAELAEPRDGSTQIDAAELVPGDVIRLRTGSRVPCDAVVVDGNGSVDESMLTGEPVPVQKRPGDTVSGATLNTDGTFTAEVTRVGTETVFARIVALVADAAKSRAPIQAFADRVAAVFTPAIIGVALLSLAAWILLAEHAGPARGIVAAVSVLIIACPCALGLATPMSITVASGNAASEGILFRDAEAIEALAAIDTLVVDKTGTLTEGRPSLCAVDLIANGETEDSLIAAAASLETASTHPLAVACREAARSRALETRAPSDVRVVAGGGLSGTVAGRTIDVGNAGYIENRGASLPPRGASPEATELWIRIDGVVAGRLAFEDAPRAETAAALAELAESGIRVIIASGDRAPAVETLAKRLGVTEAHAGVSPADKLALVEKLRAEGRAVGFAGDGINDAPALAGAHVGIAMGTGTDVAIEAGAVTLMSGTLDKLVRGIEIARAAQKNIRQNLALAFGYNTISIPVAAGALYPVAGVMLSPMIASAAMSLSSVSVIANALRLRTARSGAAAS